MILSGVAGLNGAAIWTASVLTYRAHPALSVRMCVVAAGLIVLSALIDGWQTDVAEDAELLP
jgi:hypothetical protein